MDGVQSFTLDTATNDRFHESWAHVKDPKEKKKIQNRIAQKSYREFASPSQLPAIAFGVTHTMEATLADQKARPAHESSTGKFTSPGQLS